MFVLTLKVNAEEDEIETGASLLNYAETESICYGYFFLINRRRSDN